MKTTRKKTPVSRAIVAKAQKVLKFAEKLVQEVQNDMEFINALYTPKGMVSVTFPTQAERTAFFKTKEYDRLIDLIVSLPPPPLSDEVIEFPVQMRDYGTKKTQK